MTFNYIITNQNKLKDAVDWFLLIISFWMQYRLNSINKLTLLHHYIKEQNQIGRL